jgi:hypothetical protein
VFDWRAYLDWSALEAQADAGQKLDTSVLLKLYRRFNANENGLEMYQFVTVRRALAAAIEVAVAATNDQAAETYTKRIQKLSGLVSKAAKEKTPKSLDGVGPLLARLVESRQAPGLVTKIRSAVGRPNLYMSVDESLLSSAVDRVVDRTSPVNEVVLGTPVRGTGHTSGTVFLDFLPSSQRAVTQLSFQATNLANTRSTKGPVTVCSEGLTEMTTVSPLAAKKAGNQEIPFHLYDRFHELVFQARLHSQETCDPRHDRQLMTVGSRQHSYKDLDDQLHFVSL